MARKQRARLTKVVDAEAELACHAGLGKLREEVWVDDAGKVARYNLAFINHFLCHRDDGRVLGYDMAHGYHHRHYMGQVDEIDFPGYVELAEGFRKEVSALRKKRGA